VISNDPYLSPFSNEMYITLSISVYFPNQTFDSVVATDLNLQNMGGRWRVDPHLTQLIVIATDSKLVIYNSAQVQTQISPLSQELIPNNTQA
jgi:hypothetical protein